MNDNQPVLQHYLLILGKVWTLMGKAGQAETEAARTGDGRTMLAARLLRAKLDTLDKEMTTLVRQELAGAAREMLS